MFDVQSVHCPDQAEFHTRCQAPGYYPAARSEKPATKTLTPGHLDAFLRWVLSYGGIELQQTISQHLCQAFEKQGLVPGIFFQYFKKNIPIELQQIGCLPAFA